MDIIFTKDIKALFPDVVVGMRLAILDFSQYDDWAILPLLPEQEWEIKKEAFKFFGAEGIADQLVNSNKQQENVPIPQQKQS